MADQKVESIGERDFTAERSHVRTYLQWPVNVCYGLNSFEFFQGVTNFLAHGSDTIIGLIPFINSGHNYNSYIENSVRLTRFRNYQSKII
jgi:hypothetical protein